MGWPWIERKAQKRLRAVVRACASQGKHRVQGHPDRALGSQPSLNGGVSHFLKRGASAPGAPPLS